MSKSNAEADAYLNARYRDAGALAAFGTIYFALASADITVADVTANELPASGGYVRLAIPTTNADSTAPADSGGRRMIANVNTSIGFTASANINGSNPINYGALYTALTVGTLIRAFQLGAPIIILNGMTLTIPPGALQIFER